MVVIDSINGYLNAMPAERYLTLQLHELLAYLNQQGVITIMVLAQQGLVGHDAIHGRSHLPRGHGGDVCATTRRAAR